MFSEVNCYGWYLIKSSHPLWLLKSVQKTNKQATTKKAKNIPTVHLKRLPFPFSLKQILSQRSPALYNNRQFRTTDANIIESWIQQHTDLHFPAVFLKNSNSFSGSWSADRGEGLEKAVSVFTVRGQTSGRVFFFLHTFANCAKFQRVFIKLETGFRGSSRSRNGHWAAIVVVIIYFSPMWAVTNIWILWLNSYLISTVFLWKASTVYFGSPHILRTYSWPYFYFLLRNQMKIQARLLFICNSSLLSKIINDSINIQTKKQIHNLLNVFHIQR